MSKLNKSLIKFKNEIPTYELTMKQHEYPCAHDISNFYESLEMYNLNK